MSSQVVFLCPDVCHVIFSFLTLYDLRLCSSRYWNMYMQEKCVKSRRFQQYYDLNCSISQLKKKRDTLRQQYLERQFVKPPTYFHNYRCVEKYEQQLFEEERVRLEMQRQLSFINHRLQKLQTRVKNMCFSK